MTMHGRLGMWSIRTLFTASALALLAAGCATLESQAERLEERAPLPDEEEGWAPGSAHNASAAESGPADIPLAKKKASEPSDHRGAEGNLRQDRRGLPQGQRRQA